MLKVFVLISMLFMLNSCSYQDPAIVENYTNKQYFFDKYKDSLVRDQNNQNIPNKEAGTNKSAPDNMRQKFNNKNLSRTNQSPSVTTNLVIAKPGENIEQIARKHNVSVESLARHNDLHEPFELEVGQPIEIPGTKFYEVKAGETLQIIASRFNIHYKLLAADNNLQEPYEIYVGQILEINNSDYHPQDPENLLD